MFVLPSIILAFILSFPSLMLCYKYLFNNTNGAAFKPFPSVVAVIEALAIGLLIPFLSSIIPVMRVLG